MSTYTPGREIQAFLIDQFRNDPVLTGATPSEAPGYIGGLLYPDWSPRVNADDMRVYSHRASLPVGVNTRDALPRVMVSCEWQPHSWEQDPPELTGPVRGWLRVVVPDTQEEYGDRLFTYAVQRLLSTPVNSPRILAGGLYLTNEQGLKDRIDAFEGAWEYVIGFRSASGSSLQ